MLKQRRNFRTETERQANRFATYFCATNVARVNLIRQVQDPRK